MSGVDTFSPVRASRRALLQRAALLGAGVALAPAAFGRAGFGWNGAAAATDISMMGWGSPLEKANVESGLKQFEAANPDIAVEWIHVPEDYETKLKTALAGGSPPDVFWSTNPRDYVARGVVMDITDKLKADPVLGAPDYFIEPQEQNRSTVNDRWFGIGSCWVLSHLYYNADLLEKGGVEPPSSDPEKAWTWDEFLEIGRKLTLDSAGKHPGEDGFNADDIQQWGIFWPSYYIQRDAMVYSNGGDVFTTDYTCKLGEPAALEAIQAVADLTNVHHVAPQAAMATQLGMDQMQMLASGKVAILADGSWALQDIAKMGFKYGCGVLPKMKDAKTGALAHLHVIQAKTDQPDAAWKLLTYLSSDDYQRGLCKVGLWLPSHTSLLTEEGLATWIDPAVHPEGYAEIATKYLKNNSVAVFYPAGFGEANQIITSALDPVWIGQQTAAEALNADVIAQVDKVLAENKALLDAAVKS